MINWSTTSGKTINSDTPPLEEIALNYKGTPIIASPFKKISNKGESSQPVLQDIDKIYQQNNYTNRKLHSLAEQMTKLEGPSITKLPNKIDPQRPLFTLEEPKKFTNKTDSNLLGEITKRLENLNLDKGKTINKTINNVVIKDNENDSEQ